MPHTSLQSVAHLSLINSYLDAFFNRKIQAAHDINPRYEALWREMARVANYGKRLRPLMVVHAYEGFGGTDVSKITPAAAACELLHVSMLIHDDIIDRDLMRHGQPTIQAAYFKRYGGEVSNSTDRVHNAMSAAILAGDLLLSEARSLMTKPEAENEWLRQAGYYFDQSVFEVAGGELLDVESAQAPRGTVDPLSIMAYKTASYSFIGPLMIGASLAGASADALPSLRSFALNLGIAYQLTDDILGVFGNSSDTGKPNDGDIHEGKATYLIERLYALASSDAIVEFEQYYGRKDTDDDGSSRVRALLTESGALHETERLVHRYATQAKNDLHNLELSETATSVFEDLIVRCTDRKA